MNPISEIVCPKCAAHPPTLYIETKLHAQPWGTWSLAGVQPKTSAVERPHLKCRNCDLDVPSTPTENE